MDERTRYLLALGGFRRAVRGMLESAAGLKVAAEDFDPSGIAGLDEVSAAIVDECRADLRGMADMHGIRQLFVDAIGEC